VTGSREASGDQWRHRRVAFSESGRDVAVRRMLPNSIEIVKIVRIASDPGRLRRAPAALIRQCRPRAIRARLPLELRGDTMQPFPTVSEIDVAALKALHREIAAAHEPVAA
jgi:hypothetical protein